MRILLRLAVFSLLSTPALAQTTAPAHDPAIGFRMEVVPFSVAARPPVPNRIVVATLEPLTCPMPVARGNTSADSTMAATSFTTTLEHSMPVARSGCRNPLAPGRGHP